jgi:hypothetical protein
MTSAFWKSFSFVSRIYQSAAVFYIVAALYAECKPVLHVSDLLRFSMGTAVLWPESFAHHLEHPTLSERLLLTTSSLALFILGYALQRISARVAEDRAGGVRLWSSSRVASSGLGVLAIFACLHGTSHRLGSVRGTVQVAGVSDILIQALPALFREWAFDLLLSAFGSTFLLLAFRVGDLRSCAVILGGSIAVVSGWRSRSCAVTELLFPLALWLWSNHQSENVPGPRPFGRSAGNIVSVVLGRASLIACCAGGLLAAHVVELMLLWIAAVTIAMWAPVLLLSVHTSVLSLAVAVAMEISIHFGTAAGIFLKRAALVAYLLGIPLRGVAYLCGTRVAVHVACGVSTAVFATVLLRPSTVNEVAASWPWEAATIACGVIFEISLWSRVSETERSTRRKTLTSGLYLVAGLSPAAGAHFLSGAAGLEIPPVVHGIAGLAILGVAIEHESTCKHHLGKCLRVPQG